MLQKLKKQGIDIIVIDIRKPGQNNVEPRIIVSEQYPNVKMLSLTMSDDINSDVQEPKAKEADFKNSLMDRNELLRSVKSMIRNNTHNLPRAAMNKLNSPANERVNRIPNLTKRETQVVKLIVRSMTNREIAAQLFVSELTVKTHRQNVMQKLKVKNAAGLVKFAIDNNLAGY